jgi:hypothetical protein
MPDILDASARPEPKNVASAGGRALPGPSGSVGTSAFWNSPGKQLPALAGGCLLDCCLFVGRAAEPVGPVRGRLRFPVSRRTRRVQQVNEPEMIFDEPNTLPEKVPALNPALIVTVPMIAWLLPA